MAPMARETASMSAPEKFSVTGSPGRRLGVAPAGALVCWAWAVPAVQASMALTASVCRVLRQNGVVCC